MSDYDLLIKNVQIVDGTKAPAFMGSIEGIPANKFRLTDQGILCVDACDDIVLFNLDTVTDRGDTLHPRVYPEGIEHVFVNGKQVIKDGKHTGATPRKILRREKKG